jgi:hypothetical protein
MAGHSHFTVDSVEEWYQIAPEKKKQLIIGMLIGLGMAAIGAFLISKGWGIGIEHHEHASGAHEAHAEHGLSPLMKRVIANLWVNGILFTGISVIGMFFVCYQYLAWAGWSSVFKRVPEAFPAFLPYSLGMMLVIYLVFGKDIFHWMHDGVMDKGSEHYDAIIAGKSGFLNKPFFLFRMVFTFVTWFGIWKMFRKVSLLEDELGGDEHWYKMKNIARAFIFVFAVTSSTNAWDWVMSIDTHWFSTMFGWYTFASWHVTGLAVIMLTILYLQDCGYMKYVNDSHLHDLGKFMFAFSIFWTYVWFCQFLLIYYANLPEETIYYKERFSGYGGIYKAPFFINFFLNFIFPFMVLMTRDAKRNKLFLKIGACGIVMGHYFDFYNNVMPGVVGANAGFGILEWGFILFFACAFALVILNELTKASLVAKNHPMLEEALHHDI